MRMPNISQKLQAPFAQILHGETVEFEGNVSFTRDNDPSGGKFAL